MLRSSSARSSRPAGSQRPPLEVLQAVVFRGRGVVAEEEVDADALALAQRVDRHGEEPAVARAAAPYDGVVRLPVEGAHEAVGAVVRGAEVAQRRFGSVVGREEALFDEGRGVGRMTGFVEVPLTGKIGLRRFERRRAVCRRGRATG